MDKCCSKCAETKPLDAFYPENRRGGYRAQCRECTKSQDAEWRDKNRDQKRASSAKWDVENAERKRANGRAWYAKNRERKNAQNAAWLAANYERKRETDATWRAANRDRQKASERAWVLANPDRVRANARVSVAKRKAIKAALTVVEFSADELAQKWAYWGNMCWICADHPATATDHVKPLSKGGAHMLCNLRPICKPCNSRKFNHWPYELPRAA